MIRTKPIKPGDRIRFILKAVATTPELHVRHADELMTEAAAICKLFDDWVDHLSSVIMPAYESVQKKTRDTNPVFWSASDVFPQCYCTRLHQCINLKSNGMRRLLRYGR
jgi:hypothetical protein